MAHADNNTADDTQFVIERQFTQPLPVVWKAWSEAEQLQHWWGPKRCRIEIARLEFREGGFFHYAMHFDGAPPMWGRFNYRRIVPQHELVWLNSFSNEACGIARAPFSDECPLEIENSASFSAAQGITTVRLVARPFGATEVERRYFNDLKPSMDEGYGGTFDQLADRLGA